jgi:selenocysteine lyase/cysteine desulfurase
MKKPRSLEDLEKQLQRKVRAAFPIDKKVIPLDAMTMAAPPQHVRARIEEHRQEMQKDPAGYILHQVRGQGLTRMWREADFTAELAARYLELDVYLKNNKLVPNDVIAQTTSTTMGLGLLANGIKAAAGQEVLTTRHDFSYHRAAWDLRSRRTGLGYREIRLYRDPTVADLEDRILDQIENQIRDNTRVLALTWVESYTGVKLPVRRIADIVKRVNTHRSAENRLLFVLDAVHGFGVENKSFEELGCDFFVSGCHKWIFGPRGTGIVCALPSAWAEVVPIIPSFLNTSHPGSNNSPGGLGAYEHAWAVDTAFEWLLDVGKDNIEQLTIGLATRLKDGLAQLKDVRVVTPRSHALSSGIVCCVVPDAAGAKVKLRQKGVWAMTSMDADKQPYLRFSPSIANTTKQIDKALGIIDKVING